MEDLLSIDSTSNFSSIAEPPSHLERQYGPLSQVFQDHGTKLPQRGSPDSNSEAMIHALKALQDKIRGLEVERVAAARKFQDLAEETDRHTRYTQTPLPTTASSHSSPPPYVSPFGRDNEELRTRLNSIDTKLTVQARTLDGLRQGMEHAETDRHRLLSRHAGQVEREAQDRETRGRRRHTPLPSTSPQPSDTGRTEEKMRQLEMEHARLASGHSLTQTKMKDLEHRLLADQWHRRQLGDRTTKVTDDMDRGLPKSRSGRPKMAPKKRKKAGRGSRTCTCTCGMGTVQGGPVCMCRPVPGVHYRLNLKDIPFIIGTSTAPSHSVPANYQQLLATMKSHTPLLCGAVAASRGQGSSRKGAPKTSVSQAELKTLLAGLEEEFGHLTFEHQELARELQQPRVPSSPQTTADLEKQLENLVDMMETKNEQIGIVQKQLSTSRRKARDRARPCKHTAGPSRASQSVEVESTSSAVPKSPSLDFLQRMKSLQTTLQRDDLSWD